MAAVLVGSMLTWAADGGSAAKKPEPQKAPAKTPEAETPREVPSKEVRAMMSPVRKLREPEHLPDAVKQVLLHRMGRHAQDVNELMFSVLFLEFEDAAALAERIRSEPRLARPTADDDSLNASISGRFFTLQDELRRRAGDVADAAKKKNAKATGEAYGRMMQVCVSCHATYLEVDDGGPK